MESRSRQGPGANGPAVTCATATQLCIDKRPTNIFKYNKNMYSTPLFYQLAAVAILLYSRGKYNSFQTQPCQPVKLEDVAWTASSANVNERLDRTEEVGWAKILTVWCQPCVTYQDAVCVFRRIYTNSYDCGKIRWGILRGWINQTAIYFLCAPSRLTLSSILH